MYNFPPQPVTSKLSPELSDLVVYCQTEPFQGFEAANQGPPSVMSSFSENEALKLIKDSGGICLLNSFDVLLSIKSCPAIKNESMHVFPIGLL